MGERRDSNVSIPKSSEPRPIAPAPIASEVQSSEPIPIAPWPGYNAPISRQGARQFASEVPSSRFTAFRCPPPLPRSLAPRIQPLRNMGASSSNCPSCQRFYSTVLESTAVDFAVHFLTINSGEDFCAWMAQILNENSLRGYAVLAAYGTLSRVVIWETVQGLLMAYSGCYKILSLTGLYSYADLHSQRTGGLHILFEGDGVRYSGTLGGSLIAHNRIDVLIATFGPSEQAIHTMMHQYSGQSSSNRGGPGNTVN